MDAEEHTFTGQVTGYTRKVWIAGGKDLDMGRRRICLFLDAEFYLNRMDAAGVLDYVAANEAIAPAVAVFVSNSSAEDRHHDYTCNAQYGHFVAVELLDWANELFLGTEQSKNLIVGLSLSGLAAAHIALSHPRRFSRAICQSGSFWWNGEWLTQNLPTFTRAESRFWLSVGDQETESGVVHAPTGLRQDVSQIVGCERFADALDSAGHTVHFNRYAGGHDTAPWKAELPLALEWSLKEL